MWKKRSASNAGVEKEEGELSPSSLALGGVEPIPSDLAIALGSFPSVFAQPFLILLCLPVFFPLCSFPLTTIINELEGDIHRRAPGGVRIKCTRSGYAASHSFAPPVKDSANQVTGQEEGTENPLA